VSLNPKAVALEGVGFGALSMALVGFVAAGAFPTQYSGFRTYYGAAMHELCLVATDDAPAGMGGQLRFRKGGTTRAIYLVETTDPNASAVRLRTTTGTKAVRLKT